MVHHPQTMTQKSRLCNSSLEQVESMPHFYIMDHCKRMCSDIRLTMEQNLPTLGIYKYWNHLQTLYLAQRHWLLWVPTAAPRMALDFGGVGHAIYQKSHF